MLRRHGLPPEATGKVVGNFMRPYVRAVSYFMRDWRLLGLLVGLLCAGTGLGVAMAWPMAVLVDSVLSPTPRTDWIHRLVLAPMPESRFGRIVALAALGLGMKLLQD